MSTCSRCGTTFECGMTDAAGGEPCWCTQLPILPVEAYRPNTDDAAASTCFCPAACARRSRHSTTSDAAQQEACAHLTSAN